MGEAIQAVLDGGSWFPPMAAERSEADAELAARLAQLTPQQFRVLLCLADGLLNKQIAATLGLAENTVKVHVRVVEGNRERIQIFQGVVISRKGGGVRETFTVRKVSFGVGVERTFPLHSPIISRIEVITQGRVRRAKLYYLRDRVGKAAKVKEKRRT